MSKKDVSIPTAMIATNSVSMDKQKNLEISTIRETISVISVCFNEEPPKIRDTINSIIAQDYAKIELVIIDGGSKPETLNTFDEYRGNISVFISEPDNGIFDAMNKGVSRASGDWIIFMNIGDRFYEPHSLSGLMASASSDVDILYGNVIYCNNTNLVGRPPKKLSKYQLLKKGICHQALLARRSVFSSIGQFDLYYKLCADPDWIIRAFTSGITFKYQDVVVAYYEGNGFSEDFERRKPYWDSVVRKHYSKTEIVIYQIVSALEWAIKRILKLDFSIPVRVKRFYSKQFRTNKR